MNVRCRIAPSPTGKFHIGNLYVFLYNLCFVLQNKGSLILRIDDTDQSRNDYGTFELESRKVFGTFGIDKAISEVHKQSERMHIYQELASKLISQGYAFYCNCADVKACECNRAQGALYLNVSAVLPGIASGDHLVVNDCIRGDIKFKIDTISDFVIVRSNGMPTYHFACMVDDVDMDISHVIRAEDWITSLPKHYCILYALKKVWKNANIAYVHLPLIRDNSGKLSKRNDSMSVSALLEDGFLPEAIENYLFYISHKNGDEIFSREQFLQRLEISKIRNTSPLFDFEKLLWYNRKWIQRSEMPESLSGYVNVNCKEAWPEIKNSVNTLNEAKEMFNELNNCPSREQIESCELFQTLSNYEMKQMCNIIIDSIKRDILTDQSAFKTIATESFPYGTLMRFFRMLCIGRDKGPTINLLLHSISKSELLERISKFTATL